MGKCLWTYMPEHEEGSHWETGCEHYIMSDEPLIEQVWNYCPFCGNEKEVVNTSQEHD